MEDCKHAGHLLFQKDFDLENEIGDGPYHASTVDPANDARDKPMFFAIMHNNVAVATIQNLLSVDALDELFIEKELFSYMNRKGKVEYHAATMLHIIYSKTDPTTEVGMDAILLKNWKL